MNVYVYVSIGGKDLANNVIMPFAFRSCLASDLQT